MRLVVMISGSGTNLQAIIDAIATGYLAAEIALVVSNRKAAYGLQRAKASGIPQFYFPFKPYRDSGKSREAYDTDLAEHIEIYNPDLIVLAGWMHILSPAFLERYPQKVINLHPALPGTFPGTEGIKRTYEAYKIGKVEHGGCMMHYVVPEVDAGDVIIQEIVPIKPGDTLDQFEAHIHQVEHRIIVEAIRLVGERADA